MTTATTDAITTVIRAFELPLANASADTWALIRECWRHSVMLANWCQTEMIRQDDPAAPKPPEFDLYARAFGREKEKSGRKDAGKVLPARKAAFGAKDFFAGAAISAATIIGDVQSDYRRQRHDVLVRYSRTLSTYRSYPWPVHGQQVKAAWLDAGNGRPCLRLVLPGGPVELRMRNGRDFAPQMARFRDLVARHGEGVPFKQIVLREKRCRGGDVMVKMVCEAPVRSRTGDRVIVLATDSAAFWAADYLKEGVGEGTFCRAWVLNNDHWRRVAARHAEHLRTLHRMSQDAKAERRMGGGNNRAWGQQTRLDCLCENDRNRLASFTHEAACHLAEFARRQRVGEVFYLDRDRGFIPSFPWRELHDKLAQKLEERGIALHSESQLLHAAPAPFPADGEATGSEIDLRPTTKEEDDRWERVCRLREAANRKLVRAVTRPSSHPAVSAR